VDKETGVAFTEEGRHLFNNFLGFIVYGLWFMVYSL